MTSDHSLNGFYSEHDCSIDEFKTLTSQSLSAETVPLALDVQKNIPIYDGPTLTNLLDDKQLRRGLLAEWAHVLNSSAGVFVIKSAQTDTDAIDTATSVYENIIAQEKLANGGGADHFAAAGSNDRIWNSLQKLCLASPETFARYFATPMIDAACEAWLGPNYQMTAQVNLVHPGGKAQQAHRDYHLGFQTAEVSAEYPVHVHDLSPLMTLQGGMAHCDVPIDAGPTKLLPFSQLYRPGYAAWRRTDFREYFEEAHVQLPLAKGDAIFFNPALFHAAGENRSSDIHRMVNLFQISSAFGRAMETVDRDAMTLAVFSHLAATWRENRFDQSQLDAVIAATAEGYSFPTNLDRDPPVGGLAPLTQQALLKQAVLEDWDAAKLQTKIKAQTERQHAQ